MCAGTDLAWRITGEEGHILRLLRDEGRVEPDQG